MFRANVASFNGKTMHAALMAVTLLAIALLLNVCHLIVTRILTLPTRVVYPRVNSVDVEQRDNGR